MTTEDAINSLTESEMRLVELKAAIGNTFKKVALKPDIDELSNSELLIELLKQFTDEVLRGAKVEQ